MDDQVFPGEQPPQSDEWGADPEHVDYMLSNIANLDGVGIDLERGPDPEATYMEQQASTLIYTGARRSRLHFIIKLLSWQARYKVPDIAADDLLKQMREDVIPQGRNSNGAVIQNNIPVNRGEARKVIREVGFDYDIIDVCPCDDFIYYGPVNGTLTHCPRENCNFSRYRTDLKTKNVPRKKMHYFPISPRLLALYRSPKYSRHMQWAGNNRSNGEILRYPQDGLANWHGGD